MKSLLTTTMKIADTNTIISYTELREDELRSKILCAVLTCSSKGFCKKYMYPQSRQMCVALACMQVYLINN